VAKGRFPDQGLLPPLRAPLSVAGFRHPLLRDVFGCLRWRLWLHLRSTSKDSGYDPHAFAIGASFLFALACVALATMSMRMRFMGKRMRKLAAHNEAWSTGTGN
jgi:hypothetical protein